MRGARWTAPARFEVAHTARRFEDWEFPYALVVGMGAAVDYALRQGVPECGARALALANRLRVGLAPIEGVQLLDRGRTQCAIVTATVREWTGPELTRQLAAERINVVPTLKEFAQHDFGPRGVESGVRISPHYYNTTEEIDVAVDAIRHMAARRR